MTGTSTHRNEVAGLIQSIQIAEMTGDHNILTSITAWAHVRDQADQALMALTAQARGKADDESVPQWQRPDTRRDFRYGTNWAYSWDEIGQALGISKQAARQKYAANSKRTNTTTPKETGR